MVDSHYLGYELSWEDSLLDVVDNFIHRVFQRTVIIETHIETFIKTHIDHMKIFFVPKNVLIAF